MKAAEDVRAQSLEYLGGQLNDHGYVADGRKEDARRCEEHEEGGLNVG